MADTETPEAESARRDDGEHAPRSEAQSARGRDALFAKRKNQKTTQQLLFLSVFVIATAGLVYELVAGTIASYLLGDSVTQFSTIIGAYLSAMGVGAYLSRFVVDRISQRFV